MGDKIWSFRKCPKCKQNTLECFEHDSAWLKVDNCENCDYQQNYEYSEKDGIIHVTKV